MAEILLFSAFTPGTGQELWASDGRADGTAVVRELLEGTDSGDPYATTAFGGDGWFFGRSADRFVLWTTDGTAAGTVVADPLAATDGLGGDGLMAVGDALFFVADDGTHGPEPWVVRPGSAPAAMLVDLLPGPDGSMPAPVGQLGGDPVFAASDGDDTRALWRIDGTTGEAERLTAAGVEVAAGPGVVLDGLLYFTATDADHGAELCALMAQTHQRPRSMG